MAGGVTSAMTGTLAGAVLGAWHLIVLIRRTDHGRCVAKRSRRPERGEIRRVAAGGAGRDRPLRSLRQDHRVRVERRTRGSVARRCGL